MLFSAMHGSCRSKRLKNYVVQKSVIRVLGRPVTNLTKCMYFGAVFFGIILLHFNYILFLNLSFSAKKLRVQIQMLVFRWQLLPKGQFHRLLLGRGGVKEGQRKKIKDRPLYKGI